MHVGYFSAKITHIIRRDICQNMTVTHAYVSRLTSLCFTNLKTGLLNTGTVPKSHFQNLSRKKELKKNSGSSESKK